MRVSAVDDARLMQLADDTREELFPLLRRASAFGPLLILLAVIPGLYAVQYRTLDVTSALWGMYGIDVLTGKDFVHDLGIVRNNSSDVRERASLSLWVTAISMSLLGTSDWFSLVLPSYLATVALVLMVHALLLRLGGSRFALWTMLLYTPHGVLLQQTQTPVPVSLIVLTAVGTFWGYIAHRQEKKGLISVPLVVAGISLGLCFLCTGRLALVVLATLLLHVLGLRGETLTPADIPISERRRAWTGWPALRSFVILALISFAAGGWWVALNVWEYGLESWTRWLAGATAELDDLSQPFAPSGVSAAAALGELLHLYGAVFGLAAFGLVLGVRELLSTEDEPRRRRIQFLVAWTAMGLFAWLLMLRSAGESPNVLALAGGFLIIPSLAFAAYALEEIGRRRVPFVVVLLLVGVSLAVALAQRPLQSELPMSANLVVVAAMFLAAVIAYLVHGRFIAVAAGGDTRRRILLTGLIGGLIATNAGMGISSVRRQTREDKALAFCKQELATIEGTTRCTLVHEARPAVSVWFLLRSVWPHAQLEAVDSWDRALSQALANPPRHGERNIVVDYSGKETAPANLRINDLVVRQAVPPQMLGQRPILTLEIVPIGALANTPQSR